MINILNYILIASIIVGVVIAFKNRYSVAMLSIGLFLSTILSSIGIESNRMLLMYFVFGLSIFIFVISREKLAVNKAVFCSMGVITLFLAVYLFSFTYSMAVDSEYAWWKFRGHLSLSFIPVVILLLIGYFKKKEREFIEKFIIFVSTIFSIYLFYLFLTNRNAIIEGAWFQRQTIGSVNPIWLARFMSIGFIILQTKQYGRKPLLSIGLSLLILSSSLLTGSKIILFMTVPIGLYIRFQNSGFKRAVLKNIVFIGIFTVLAICFLNIFNSDAILRRFSLQSNTIDQRIALYQMTFNAYLYKGNLWFGNGIGTIGDSLGLGFVRWYPHNLFLELLYEIGITGVFTYLLQVVFMIVTFIRMKNNWLFWAYILNFLFSLTSGDLVSNNLMYLFFALYILSNKNIVFSSNEVEETLGPKRSF
ncbi:MAG: hypothetical protein N2645_16845 [Clostridia bacterium]|nr:hypothetical protein [Clostridia bacterium]